MVARGGADEGPATVGAAGDCAPEAAGAGAPVAVAGAAEAEADAAAVVFVDFPLVCANAGAMTSTGTTTAAQSALSQRILDPFSRGFQAVAKKILAPGACVP